MKLQLSLLDFNHLTIFFQHYEYIGDFAKSEQKTCKLTVWNCNNQVQIYRGAAQYSKGLYFLWFFIKPQIQWGNFKMSGHGQSWYPARILVLNNHLFVLSSLSKIQLKDTIIIFENYGRKIFIKSWYIPMILIDPYLMNLPTLCNVYRI